MVLVILILGSRKVPQPFPNTVLARLCCPLLRVLFAGMPAAHRGGWGDAENTLTHVLDAHPLPVFRMLNKTQSQNKRIHSQSYLCQVYPQGRLSKPRGGWRPPETRVHLVWAVKKTAAISSNYQNSFLNLKNEN